MKMYKDVSFAIAIAAIALTHQSQAAVIYSTAGSTYLTEF